MNEADNQDLKPENRRDFFRDALFRVMRPAANYLEKKLPPAIKEAMEGSRLSGGNTVLLRPPGALAESEFLHACLRCGNCANHCPADAIQLLPNNDPRAQARESLKGTPFIDSSDRACVICDELACMKSCPSGALQLVDRLSIRIGMAIVDEEACVRSRGENCTTCVDVCPIGKEAIRIGADGRIEVIDPSCSGVGCTGCGVCEERCPTRPKRAIHVRAYPEHRISM
ncbi:MAG: 4Fe-4S dicluster domain-containing protein [Planctomycetes bacterium]|nr:4Fe-4S dicluster domain-containing protein [Planctomycetota bacterium]